MIDKRLLHLTQAAVIAALYTALTLALAPVSFGPIQFRVAEMLTVLPVFTSAAIPGLAVGCMISNAVGMAMGANIAGGLDIIFGTAATLAAAVLTYYLRSIRWLKLPIAATLPPVILNALIIGGELSAVLKIPFALSAAEVLLGQAVSCCAAGLILFAIIDRLSYRVKKYIIM